MQFTIEFDENNSICTVRVSGRHKRPKDSLALQKIAREYGEKYDWQRFLIDMTDAEIIGGPMDAFTVGTVPIDSDRAQARQRVALLYKENLFSHKLLETVATNRGYQLRIFDDYDDAITWLSGNT